MSRSRGEEMASALRATVEYTDEHPENVGTRAGTFAYVTVNSVTSCGFDLEDAFTNVCDLAAQIRRHSYGDDAPSAWEARSEIGRLLKEVPEATREAVLKLFDAGIKDVCEQEVRVCEDQAERTDDHHACKAYEAIAEHLRRTAARYTEDK